MEDQLFGENSQLKEFQCPICLKQFSRKFTLDMHLLIHKGVKPHPCPFCGKCFRQKGTLMRHKALHSSNNLFHCSLCDRGFRQKNVFLHHLKHRHNVSTETLDRRKYRTELKDYQSIMDTLPPFVHADSTAIASSEKHLDAMLFESLNHSVCDSSDADGTSEQLEKVCTDSQNLICSGMQTTSSNSGVKGDLREVSDKSGFKGFGYECNFCLKMFFEYNQYKQHIEESHNNEETLLECKPILLQSAYSSSETPLHSDAPQNNEESALKPNSTDTDLSTNDAPCHNSFNGVSSSNDVNGNVNSGISCHQNFSTSEDCPMKTHVQSALIRDCETYEDVKPTTLNPSSFSSSLNNICDKVSVTPSFTNSSETVPQPLVNTNMCKREAVINEMCSINDISTGSLVENCFKSNTKLVSPVKSRFCTQSEFPDSASSHNTKSLMNLKPILSAAYHYNLYKCKLCRKSYRSELSFEYHMQMHLSSKSFNCGYCKKRFSSKQLLLSHTRSSHMKNFRCSSCLRLFNYRTLYFQHKKHCCETSSNIQNFKKVINLPLVDIQKLLNSNTNGIIGVIPVSDPESCSGVNTKIGIPIVSLDSIKNISNLPLLNSSIEVNGALK